VDDRLTQLLVDSAIALGIGLFVGLEREHHEVMREGPHPQSIMGARTFALLSLFGWIAALLGEGAPWLPPVVVGVAGGLVGAQYYRGATDGHGLTTEVAAMVTLLLGMLVHVSREMAVALALVTTLLLLSKPWFSSLVPRLRRVELTATLQLGIVLAIVLPLLPTEARDPWGVLSPRKIGLFITLIAGINYVGYILNRIFGEQRGSGLAGAVGGLASSTAVTVAMAQQSRRAPSLTAAGQLATLIACAVMYPRMLVITTLVSPSVAALLALPFSVMCAFTLVGVVWKWRELRAAPQPEEEAAQLELQNPFALLPALKWGLFFCVVLVVASVAKRWFGDRGVVIAAAGAGLADVDAITLATTRQVAESQLAAHVAKLAIVAAAVSNTLVKAGIAWFSGGRGFGGDVARILGLSVAVGLAVAALH
jgi:uncharacterized membrane protein (DUF4010 family)